MATEEAHVPGESTSEFGSECWKEVPDDFLSDIFLQLGANPSLLNDNDMLPEGALLTSLDFEGKDLLSCSSSLASSYLPTVAMTPQPVQLPTKATHPLPDTSPSRPLKKIKAPSDSADSSGIVSIAPLSGQSVTKEAIGPSTPSVVSTSFTPSTELLTACTIIEQISQLQKAQEQQIEQLRSLQKTLLMAPQPETIRQLQEQQWKLYQQIELELKDMNTFNRTLMLNPGPLTNSRLLSQQLVHQQQRIDVLRQELQYVNSKDTISVPAALVILEQPIPQVLFKGKAIDDSFKVQLITGVNLDIKSLGKVRASLFVTDNEQGWKAEKPITNDESVMDQINYTAAFPNIKINISSRMGLVQLKFEVQISYLRDGKINTTQIVSQSTYPFVVITNESQWCEAESKLILADAFGGQNTKEISWTWFANVLHHHFLKATRQDCQKPNRSVGPLEWDFFHSRFFGRSQTVTHHQTSQFWFWFGLIIQTLRFKRHINKLWCSGLIYGIISKEDCNRELAQHEIGTFVIRFSETYPGFFAVAYVSDDPDERIKHYLVKPEDTGSQKTLPDFLHEKSQFRYLLQFDFTNNTLQRFQKDTILKNYYSKSRISKPENGYVLLG